MPVVEKPYTLAVSLAVPVGVARARAVEALRGEGFGILTEIDVAATMKAKLGVEEPPYVILGACNPALAHAALAADPSVGALLPCNVVVRAVPEGSIVEIMDPAAVLAIAGVEALEPLGADARARLLRVAADLAAGT